MKIAAITTTLCCPGRNFLTVKIETDTGVTGIGDGTLNGRERAVEAYLEDHVAPCLIGRDPHTIEDIWQYLYRGAYWRRGPVTMAAIAAIDMALWDIKGKVAGLPVYQLLGGASRDHVRLYGHANGETVEETVSMAEALVADGFNAVRLQCAVPGLPVTYGVLGDKADYFELQGNRPLPPEETWSTRRYFDLVEPLFETAHARLGTQVDLLHDVHNRLTPIEAGRLGRMLEPYGLLFLEDPCMAENQDSLAVVRNATTTPLAIGETFTTVWDARTLIETQTLDYLRMAATHAGGITAMRRTSDFASHYNVRTAPHGAPDLSPICFAAHMHLNIWAPNFGIQEFAGAPNAEMDRVFKTTARVSGGTAHPGDAPGLGVEFDEAAAADYPYKRSYLPVSRLEDGTMWNW